MFVGLKYFLLLSLMVLVDCDSYSDLIKSETFIKIEPLKINLSPNLTLDQVDCELTVHKDSCRNEAMRTEDTISWYTNVCIKWKCLARNVAIKVHKCWAGSKKTPVVMIGEDGCTAEGSMIKSPYYNPNSLNEAQSYGRLSVRVLGHNTIKLGCTISLCDYCDTKCLKKNHPMCSDHTSAAELDGKRPWQDLPFIKDICDPLSDEDFMQLLSSSNQVYLNFSIIFLITFIHLLNRQ